MARAWLLPCAPRTGRCALDTGAQTFDRGTPQALFESRSAALSTLSFGYAVTSDGKRFLMPVAAGKSAEAPPLTVVVNWLASVKR